MNENVILTNKDEKKLELNLVEDKKYKVLVYYPKTEYKVLNIAISNKINNYIDDFKISVNNKEINNQYFFLNILYDEYKYKNYISYVFHIESFLGEVHPIQSIWTINYDSDSDKLIDIDYLIVNNPNILYDFSSYTRAVLSKNEKITNYSLMINGTSPKKSNFERFVFDKKGILLFFERYQIAPYNLGEFVITIPYDSISLS